MYRCTKCIYRTVITFKEYFFKCKAVYNTKEGTIRKYKTFKNVSIYSSSIVLIEHSLTH